MAAAAASSRFLGGFADLIPTIFCRKVPAGLNHRHILINQFLLFLELPLHNAIQSGRSAGHYKAFPKETVFHGLRKRFDRRKTRNTADSSHQRHVRG